MWSRSRVLEWGLVALVLLSTLSLLVVRMRPGTALERLDSPVVDQVQRLTLQVPPQADEIVVILLDDDGLTWLGERWPLPRTVWASFLRALSSYQPAAIAVDAWFESPEPTKDVDLVLDLADRLRLSGLAFEDPGATLAAQLDVQADQLDGDLQLTRALADSGRALLGFTCFQGLEQTQLTGARPLPEGPTPDMQCDALAGSHAALGLVAADQGAVSVLHDPDGRVRRYPHLLTSGGQRWPSLALAALRLGRPDAFDEALARVEQADAGSPWLRALRPEAFTTLGFTDLLLAAPGDEALTRTLQGKLVFVGVSAKGATDRVVGALGGRMPGVYLHANAAVDLLEGRHPVSGGRAGLLGLLLGGSLLLLVTLGSARMRSAPALLGLGALAVAAWLSVALLLLPQGLVLPVALPALGLAALTLVRTSFAWVRVVRDREHIRRTFGRYVNEEVVRAILASGDLQLGGEEREVTILFSDLRGYSTILENLPPTEAVSLVNEYLGEMAALVQHHQGTVLEFIGDAVLAVFSAPLPLEDHAQHAVSCALAMRERLGELNEAWEASGKDAAWKSLGMDALGARIGIHTGVVVAGNLGGMTRMKYGVIGDTVNVAARLEALNKKLDTTILVSGDTWARLEQAPEQGRSTGEHQVKGRERVVEVWAV